jgi:enoyl-CoA hydratase
MSDILVESRGAIATVAFNRPRVRNAINHAMWSEIARVTEGLVKDDSIRAIVYRGAGTEAFASGADISEFTENRKDIETASRYNREVEGAYAAIRHCPKPTVAMIYGADAVGQLVDLVGPAYAKDILFSARAVGDREALAIGFLQRLLAVGELEAFTYDYLATVADNAPLSVRGAKQTVQAYLDGLTPERRERLRALARDSSESEDYREGTRAFLEKRRPRFQGR